MANNSTGDKNIMMSELVKCLEVARQLKGQADDAIVESILESLSKLISMVTPSSPPRQQLTVDSVTTGIASPRSASESPISGNSRQAFRDQERREITKKRKSLPKWTKQIQVCSGQGLEVPTEDEYSWRKYGQKDILGAKYPRAYYRCTHQKSQGCLATKKVQRSDHHPTIFEITYSGEHTCMQNQSAKNTISSMHVEGGLHQSLDNYFLQNYKSGLTVKIEGWENHGNTSSFSFPSTPVTNTQENHIFSLDNPSFAVGNNSNFSPFISPTTSESNYFPASSFQGFGGLSYPHTSESDLIEIISAATSTTNSPLMGLEFQQEHLDFDIDLPFQSTSLSEKIIEETPEAKTYRC